MRAGRAALASLAVSVVAGCSAGSAPAAEPVMTWESDRGQIAMYSSGPYVPTADQVVITTNPYAIILVLPRESSLDDVVVGKALAALVGPILTEDNPVEDQVAAAASVVRGVEENLGALYTLNWQTGPCDDLQPAAVGPEIVLSAPGLGGSTPDYQVSVRSDGTWSRVPGDRHVGALPPGDVELHTFRADCGG